MNIPVESLESAVDMLLAISFQSQGATCYLLVICQYRCPNKGQAESSCCHVPLHFEVLTRRRHLSLNVLLRVGLNKNAFTVSGSSIELYEIDSDDSFLAYRFGPQ
jgi:hypothetical protein